MSRRFLLFLAIVAAIMAAQTCYAGSTGTEFTSIYQTITDWATGYLGKTIAIAIFLVGMCIGIVRQSLMAIALGIGGAMAVTYTPQIIDSVVSAML